jgi:hypothetical protein
MQVPPDQAEDAIAWSRQPIAPFEVVFDTVDVVSFAPVRVLQQQRLTGQVGAAAGEPALATIG